MSHSRTNLTQARWLALPGEHPDACLLRAGYRENMLKVARAIGWAADWRTLRSRPTMAAIVERTGLSLRTCQRWCRWLEQRGFLLVLEPGTTPRFSPGILAQDGPNSAREWQLVDPAVTPTGFSDLELEAPSQVHARGANSQPQQKEGRPPLSQHGGRPGMFAITRLSDTRDLAAHPVLRKIAPRMLRYTIRPYARAGFSAADILHAIEYRPDGQQWMHGDAVRVPHRWLAHRLSAWLDASGQPLPPHSAQLRQRAERQRAERYVAPPPLPPETALAGAALARELLARAAADIGPTPARRPGRGPQSRTRVASGQPAGQRLR